MKEFTGTCCTCGRGQRDFKDQPDDRPFIMAAERAPMCGPCRRSGHHAANAKMAASTIPVQAITPARSTPTTARPVTTHGQPVMMHRSIAPADRNAPHMEPAAPAEPARPQSLTGAPAPEVTLLELAYRERLQGAKR